MIGGAEAGYLESSGLQQMFNSGELVVWAFRLDEHSEPASHPRVQRRESNAVANLARCAILHTGTAPDDVTCRRHAEVVDGGEKPGAPAKVLPQPGALAPALTLSDRLSSTIDLDDL